MSTAEYWDINSGEEITDSELQERYRDMLDEVYGEIEICGLKYTASLALERVDETAFRVGFNDWVDSEIGESITDKDPSEEADDDEE